MVGHREPEDCWHRPENGQYADAEVRERSKIANRALLELLIGQGQQLCLALCCPLGRVDCSNTMRDALQFQAPSCRPRKAVVCGCADIADDDSRRIALATGAHGRDDFDLVVMAVFQQCNLGVDVVDRIDHEIRLLSAFSPRPQQPFGILPVKLLQAQVELDPGGDGPQPPLQALHLGQPHVRQCCHRVSVQAAQGHLVEVDQPQPRDAGPGERRCRVAADAAAAHHDHEGAAQLVEPLGGQEDAVPRQLLEDQLIVEVAGLGPSRECLGPDVFLVGRRYRSEARELLGQRVLLVISTPPSSQDPASQDGGGVLGGSYRGCW